MYAPLRLSSLVVAISCLLIAAGSPFGGSPASASEGLVSADDFYAVSMGASLTVSGDGGVMANDVVTSSVKARLMSTPVHGTISGAAEFEGGGFTFHPAAGYVGFDTFSYCLAYAQPRPCESNIATVIIRVGDPTVTRVAGSDRFEVATRVAQLTNPSPVHSNILLIASGENYPDALSAAPAARTFGAALLLVRKTSIPDVVEREIERLHPAEITVIGGPATVSEVVLTELAGLVQAGVPVNRITGADRYAVSRAVATQLMKTSAHAYVATGANFPDALAAGAIAAGRKEPVVLVDGGSAAVDAETQATFLGLSTSGITLVGGERSISAEAEATLRGIATVDRVGGADRYEVAAALARASISSSTTAFIATGLTFPDALVGGVYAGKSSSPLYIAPGTCVPTSVLADLARIGANEITLLGGMNSLSDAVMRLEHC